MTAKISSAYQRQKRTWTISHRARKNVEEKTVHPCKFASS